MLEDEPQNIDPGVIFLQLEAVVDENSEKSNALNGLRNLYESLQNGNTPVENDMRYITDFYGAFEDEIEKNPQLRVIVEDIEDQL